MQLFFKFSQGHIYTNKTTKDRLFHLHVFPHTNYYLLLLGSIGTSHYRIPVGFSNSRESNWHEWWLGREAFVFVFVWLGKFPFCPRGIKVLRVGPRQALHPRPHRPRLNSEITISARRIEIPQVLPTRCLLEEEFFDTHVLESSSNTPIHLTNASSFAKFRTHSIDISTSSL